MIRQLTILAGVLFAAVMIGIGETTTAYASGRDDTVEYRWMAASGAHDFGVLCPPGGTPCPDAAKTVDGEMIEVVGEGTLRVREGKANRARGGGSYRHTDQAGNLVDLGTWQAKKLDSFVDFGPSRILPPSWRMGRAVIEIKMTSDFTGRSSKAWMELGCRLPQPVTPAPAGTIEGIRLRVKGGPDFSEVVDPRGTLFIQLDPEDDDDKDDDKDD